MGEQYQQTTGSYESAQPEPRSVISAWGTAIQHTAKLATPIISSPIFFPVSVGLVAGFVTFTGKDTPPLEGNFIPFFLVCGTAAMITKVIPSAICPIAISYLALKKFGR